ncbi:PD-(D/E)XK nuclease superfamily protein [Meiothermus ruber]|jgi:hypothetical protein|uniref:PD-(D/E)XK nuclease domain-containing protein n=1 Tax=Meiothermus ruber (strain ATCC 35948 / DSM 1279 / VKM B-1258 / 21) TaxID=504728 RepID=A0A806CS12_MEIRD|nr:PD-(D/E)XK nuclease superfamily protein [Meiothermus ruber]ADD28227.1 hypothetical protein Mrub_1465 [Meiothermus ruber DSM 1279]
MSASLRERIKFLLEQILKNCGLNDYVVQEEYLSPLGSAIRETGRRVDIAVLRKENGELKPYLYIECKEQKTSGSAEDKLFRALEEAKRDRLLGVHSIVVFSGAGFRQSYERWAMVEGFVREEYADLWFKRFFCRE